MVLESLRSIGWIDGTAYVSRIVFNGQLCPNFRAKSMFWLHSFIDLAETY